MNKIIITGIIAFGFLVGCSSTSNSVPAPTVTVTEEFPQEPEQYISNEDRFVSFIRDNGGPYGEGSNTSDILDIGNTICNAYSAGVSKNDIVSALAESLVKNNMNDEYGTQFAAALLVGAEKYLCPGDV
jgi:hypothetical protein